MKKCEWVLTTTPPFPPPSVLSDYFKSPKSLLRLQHSPTTTPKPLLHLPSSLAAASLRNLSHSAPPKPLLHLQHSPTTTPHVKLYLHYAPLTPVKPLLYLHQRLQAPPKPHHTLHYAPLTPAKPLLYLRYRGI